MAKKVPKLVIEEPLTFAPEVNQLLEKGKAHGFVNVREMLQVFPDASINGLVKVKVGDSWYDIK